MGANSETEHQDVLELFLRNDDHDLHSSPNQGRNGKHGRGKMHKKYDGKNLKVRDHMGVQGGFYN